MEHMPFCGCLEQNLLMDEEAVKEAKLCSDSPGSELKRKCVCSLLLKSNPTQKAFGGNLPTNDINVKKENTVVYLKKKRNHMSVPETVHIKQNTQISIHKAASYGRNACDPFLPIGKVRNRLWKAD